MDNANAFVAQESDDSFSYSVRVAGFDLLGVSLRRVTSTSVSFSDPHVLIFADIARAQHDRHDQRLPGYHPTCHRPISAAARFRQPRLVPRPMCISSYAQELTGKSRRWRSLEAALAAVGSQGEEMLDAIDDEIDSGRGKPIDFEALLTNVIPNYLVLSRKSRLFSISISNQSAHNSSLNGGFTQSSRSFRAAHSCSQVSTQSCCPDSSLCSTSRQPSRS